MPLSPIEICGTLELGGSATPALAPATPRLSTREQIAYATPRHTVLFGGTGQARMVAPILQRRGCSIFAVYDRNRRIASPFPDVPIFHDREGLILEVGFDRLRPENEGRPMGALVTIARGVDRLDLQSWLETQTAWQVFSVIHDTVVFEEDIEMGLGCQLLRQCGIGTGVRLGRAVIVSAKANVEHDCVLEDGSQVGPGAVLCGNVTVGARAFVGAGAIVKPHVTIGADAIVGMGAVVTKDVAPGITVVGMPAQLHVRDRQSD